MEREPDVVGVFTRAATTYRRVGPDLFGHFGSRIVDLLELRSGCSVLDVACGSGAVLAEAARAIGPEGRAIGVDLTPAMVTRATLGVERPLIAVMDGHALGFADNRFDAAACNFALTYFADPRRALTECRRTLHRQGRFGLVVHDGWWWHDDPRWTWHARLLEQFGNRYATAARRFSDFDSVVAILQQAGFTDVAATVEPFDLTWPDASRWWDWCWSHGYRAVLEQFDAATLDEFQAACFSHLPTGSIEGTLPVICAVATKPG